MTRRTVVFSEEKKEIIERALSWVVKEGSQWVVYANGSARECTGPGFDEADKFATGLRSSSIGSHCVFRFSESLFFRGNPIAALIHQGQSTAALVERAKQTAEETGKPLREYAKQNKIAHFNPHKQTLLDEYQLPLDAQSIYKTCTNYGIRQVEGRWEIYLDALVAPKKLDRAPVTEETDENGNVLLVRNLEEVLLEKREFETAREAARYLEAVLTVAAVEIKCYCDSIVEKLRGFSASQNDRLVLNKLIAKLEKCSGKLSAMSALLTGDPNEPGPLKSVFFGRSTVCAQVLKIENKSLDDQLHELAEKVKTGASLENNVVLEQQREGGVLSELRHF